MLAIKELEAQDETQYETNRRLAFCMVAAGMNKKLAQQFNKIYPAYRGHDKESTRAKAEETLRKFREIDAKKQING